MNLSQPASEPHSAKTQPTPSSSSSLTSSKGAVPGLSSGPRRPDGVEKAIGAVQDSAGATGPRGEEGEVHYGKTRCINVCPGQPGMHGQCTRPERTLRDEEERYVLRCTAQCKNLLHKSCFRKMCLRLMGHVQLAHTAQCFTPDCWGTILSLHLEKHDEQSGEWKVVRWVLSPPLAGNGGAGQVKNNIVHNGPRGRAGGGHLGQNNIAQHGSPEDRKKSTGALAASERRRLRRQLRREARGDRRELEGDHNARWTEQQQANREPAESEAAALEAEREVAAAEEQAEESAAQRALRQEMETLRIQRLLQEKQVRVLSHDKEQEQLQKLARERKGHHKERRKKAWLDPSVDTRFRGTLEEFHQRELERLEMEQLETEQLELARLASLHNSLPPHTTPDPSGPVFSGRRATWFDPDNAPPWLRPQSQNPGNYNHLVAPLAPGNNPQVANVGPYGLGMGRPSQMDRMANGEEEEDEQDDEDENEDEEEEAVLPDSGSHIGEFMLGDPLRKSRLLLLSRLPAQLTALGTNQVKGRLEAVFGLYGKLRVRVLDAVKHGPCALLAFASPAEAHLARTLSNLKSYVEMDLIKVQPQLSPYHPLYVNPANPPRLSLEVLQEPLQYSGYRPAHGQSNWQEPWSGQTFLHENEEEKEEEDEEDDEDEEEEEEAWREEEAGKGEGVESREAKEAQDLLLKAKDEKDAHDDALRKAKEEREAQDMRMALEHALQAERMAMPSFDPNFPPPGLHAPVHPTLPPTAPIFPQPVHPTPPPTAPIFPQPLLFPLSSGSTTPQQYGRPPQGKKANETAAVKEVVGGERFPPLLARKESAQAVGRSMYQKPPSPASAAFPTIAQALAKDGAWAGRSVESRPWSSLPALQRPERKHNHVAASTTTAPGGKPTHRPPVISKPTTPGVNHKPAVSRGKPQKQLDGRPQVPRTKDWLSMAGIKISSEGTKAPDVSRGGQPEHEAVEEQEGEQAQLCVVCLEVEPGVMFLPCMHAETCEGCARQLSFCPLCRAEIRELV
eukprot:g72926.t1